MKQSPGPRDAARPGAFTGSATTRMHFPRVEGNIPGRHDTIILVSTDSREIAAGSGTLHLSNDYIHRILHSEHRYKTINQPHRTLIGVHISKERKPYEKTIHF